MLGTVEAVALLVLLGLVIVAPKKLPDLAKSIGTARKEFKKANKEAKEIDDSSDSQEE